MIYSTYLSNLKKIPSDAVKIFIARQAKPVVVESLKKYDCLWAKRFAPTDELRDEFKNKEIEWKEFVEKYLVEQAYDIMKVSILRLGLMKIIEDAHKEGKDIYFICYEKDPLECHRTPWCNFISVYLKTEYKEADFSESKDS